MNLAEILKDSDYRLSQFKAEEIDSLEQAIFLKQTKNGDVPYVKCLVRNKDIRLTPEETIRQLYLRVLIDRHQYLTNRIRVEYEVSFGREKKRADIAIMDKDRPTVPYIIVELKKPKLKDGKDQLRSYCNATGAPIAVWTNGDQISHYHRKDPNYFEDITDIPNANQTLADILNIRFTLDDLVKKDKLVTEKKSLKTLIQEMEDEVLANAGVDVFEELFKLIFTKLFDEWESGRGNRRNTRVLEFRNTGQTEGELRTKIQGLFDRAKKKWEGVFKDGDKITLSPSHLSICVSSLENVKLFNSNLDVVDEAFEYLINQTSKGEKGQYFTPRYVIDMCVKMLNPQASESLIDTAAGSSGFPVHAMFYVWRQIYRDEGLTIDPMFTADEKLPACEDYVTEKVFAIDFDEKAVRVARTLNLIAGDGQTNVLYLNTLDYEMWDERIKDDDWRDVYNDGFKRLRGYQAQKGDYKAFKFDIVMANPPFAGEIKEQRITAKYDLALKPNGKRAEKMGRDILFIERNLDCLKPGGRMAVVLPQGRFNNSSDKHIRDVIAERCRILAVVGLHGNTFKPHTGTKTSVLFVQKWNDDPKVGALCPRVEDYNIFFATMRKSGKDNSGEKIYVKKPDGSGEFLLDEHGHLMVDHDLFNHDGLTQDGIAEAFIEFAKKEKLSFFNPSPSVEPFDRARYDRLMDGLEANEVNFKTVENESYSFRIDSTFFHKEFFLSVLHDLKCVEFSQFCIIKSGTTPTDRDETLKEGTILLKTNDIRNNILTNNDIENFFYINEEINQRMQNTELEAEDVLINIVGATTDVIGRAAIVASDFPKSNITQAMSLLRIQDKESIDPYYLFSFLAGKYGNQQVRRIARPTGQYNLNLIEVGTFKIPVLLGDFQLHLRKLVNQSQKLIEQSKNIYKQAEELLLSELGLKDWQPIEDTIAVKRFSDSWGGCDRGDAEYYQPKFDEVEKRLKKYSKGWDYLGNRFSVETGEYSEEYFLKTENSKFYIRNTNITGGRVEPDGDYYVDPINFSKFTRGGDILTARVGAIGAFGTVDESLAGSIYSDNVLSLRSDKAENLISDVYTLYFNTRPNRALMNRISGGSVQPLVTQTSIKSLPIPVLGITFQKLLAEKISSSFKLKTQSKQLLEIAKTGVERAIEDDEEGAIDWMNQQLEALDINLTTTT